MVLAMGATGAFAADPLVGTWHLVVSKSSYKPGPPPRSQVRVYEAMPKGMKVKVTTVYADGRTNVAEYESDDDGRDYPVTGRSLGETLSMVKVDDYLAQVNIKHAGKPIAFVLREISRDGKSMTMTFDGNLGVNGVDERIHNVAVYERR
jgi:hypothetical protein